MSIMQEDLKKERKKMNWKKVQKISKWRGGRIQPKKRDEGTREKKKIETEGGGQK
jgi:hypothetical protein